MKKLVFSALLMAGLVPAANAQGYLRTSGQKIVNEKGENIILRGMGLGGWMLQEGYMLRLQGTNPQYSIRKRIEELIGAEQTKQFYDAWLNNFITKADIDSMRKWGFNSVRLPMHYNLYTLPVDQEPDSTKQTWLERGFELTDKLLSWCKANKMYLILDLHAAPGGQGNDLNIADRDSTKPSLWQSPANQAKTIALWKKLAERYKDEPWIGAYDIINEPNWGFEDLANDKNGLKESSNKPLRELMVKITEAIRAVDKKHIVIIEGNGWGNNYKGVFPLWDNNMVISFHKYWNYNDPKSIQHMLDARNQNNAPVWVGETGENSNVWFADAVQLFESNNIGWCWWPLKKLGNNNPLEIKSNASYNKVVDYWNSRGKSAAPTEAEARNGLMELAAHTNIRYNGVCRDVIDALIRQPFNAKAIPFAKNNGSINAVDYDLGRNGIAYYDKDTGNYRVSTGRNSAGNRGRMYRNDGVDIYRDSVDGSYYVGNIEEGEWLQYTVNADRHATYDLKMVASAAGNVTVRIDGNTLVENIALGGQPGWQTQSLGKMDLEKGTHVIRILASKGGFNFRQLLLTAPQLNAQSLPRSTQQAEKFKEGAILNYMTDVNETKQDLHSLMILRHGKVIAEVWLGDNAADKPHILNSVSKTFTATAIGFLVAEKKLKLTDKVISFFPEYLPDTVNDYLKQLEVKHLLTMSVGHDVNKMNRNESNDWRKLFLSNPITEKPGSQFAYNSLATYMLSAIAQKITGQKLVDYLTPRLFQPLGITGARWEEDTHGINVGGWGLFVKTEDMAKLGQFILQKGKWNGKQLLPKLWFDEATRKQIESLPAGVKKEDVKVKKEDSDWLQGYGYQMWRSRHDSYRADGARGQFVLILPQYDAVIVTTADIGDMQAELNLIWKHLLPAFL